MKIKKIEGLTDIYMEHMEGTNEWYFCKECEDSFCDLYEAEEIIQHTGRFPGATCYLIHYPDGTVYRPFEMKENVYVESPIYIDGKLAFLAVDFTEKRIRIYFYLPEKDSLQLLTDLPLDTVPDTYNLHLYCSPVMLGRCSQENTFELIWPERVTIAIANTEAFLYRDNNDLYFSKWYEDPNYRETVVVRDLITSEVKNTFPGSIYRMPDGTFWRV